MSKALDQIQPLEIGAIEAWGEVPPIPALITDAAHNLYADVALWEQRAHMLEAELELVKRERDAARHWAHIWKAAVKRVRAETTGNL